ncbi:GGDEF domain-containing protein [Marinomonas sp. UCMA 3892]|uniref:diguanylate cyclase n=2 Tax=Marinomonas TaxID=28253 RepID=A6VWM3_MARMS|nr:GGDEF domain-containing protein [Marinomonas sp. UCMA 3892]
MFSSIKKIIGKLLDIGFEDEFGNDLNQKHVVNFSYMMFCISCLFMLIVFSLRQMSSVAIFSLIGLLIGVIGLRYSYIGYFSRAQLLMPILQISQISILSLFYFGTNSGFHWLFVSVIAYSFVVFRVDQNFAKYWIVSISIVLFLMCELLNTRGIYLTSFDQSVVVVFVFLALSFNFAMVINLVIKRLKSVNSHLRTLAEMDELTGLSNRRKVLADAVNIFADSVINRESCVFAIVDLDHFKKINDTFGHEAGDLVLAKVSAMMASVIRSQDEIGRYGGEEFIVIMPDTSLKDAEVVMERMRQSVENMLIETEHGIVIPVTVSIGVAAIAPSVSRYEEILAQADKGLYTAKRNGRNRVSVQSDYQS